MQIEKNIAATLHRKMEEEKKTKMEFSQELGIPRSTFQGYLKGEKSLRSDSIEELAKSLGISPAQLISGPECMSGDQNLDAILMEAAFLHPQAQTLAKEAVSLLQTAFRVSDTLNGIERPPEGAEESERIYQYTIREMWDPFREACSYGLLCKKRMPEGWMTVAAAAPFSSSKSAVAGLAKRCTDLQLSPEHMLDVVCDFITEERQKKRGGL